MWEPQADPATQAFRANLVQLAQVSGYSNPGMVLSREAWFRAIVSYLGPGEVFERVLTGTEPTYEKHEYVAVGTRDHFFEAMIWEKPMFGPMKFRVATQEWWKITSVGLVPGKAGAVGVHLVGGYPQSGDKFNGLYPPAAEQFIAYARERIATQHVAPSGSSVIGDLEKLARLRESGALTEEEFVLAKRKLLGS